MKGWASVFPPLYDNRCALTASMGREEAGWTLATCTIWRGRKHIRLGQCICTTSMHDVLYSNSTSQAMHWFRH